jgi:hypothetical protein
MWYAIECIRGVRSQVKDCTAIQFRQRHSYLAVIVRLDFLPVGFNAVFKNLRSFIQKQLNYFDTPHKCSILFYLVNLAF